MGRPFHLSSEKTSAGSAACSADLLLATSGSWVSKEPNPKDLTKSNGFCGQCMSIKCPNVLQMSCKCFGLYTVHFLFMYCNFLYRTLLYSVSATCMSVSFVYRCIDNH